MAFEPWVRPAQAAARATGEASRFCLGGEEIRRDVWLVPGEAPADKVVPKNFILLMIVVWRARQGVIQTGQGLVRSCLPVTV